MVKKRKSDASRLDEVDRTMYTTFCSAANSLSQLYTHAMNQQKLAFHAGERHGMEKLYNWIFSQEEEGSRVMGAELVAYLKNELDHDGEDVSMYPRLQLQQQNAQPSMHTSASVQASSSPFGQVVPGQSPLSWHSDHAKNSVFFSNALSSPVRHSLQPFHSAQGGYYLNNILPAGTGPARNQDANIPHQTRDPSYLDNDTSMDMHAESPNYDTQ